MQRTAGRAAPGGTAWLLLLLAVAAPVAVVADLPLHCLPEDALGSWTFVSDDAPHKTFQACGHATPNSVHSMLSLVGEEPRRQWVAERERFEVTLTNKVEGEGPNRHLVAVASDGRRGSWTMVFDEGFEVRLDGHSYFAHFEFELLPGQVATEGDALDKIGEFHGRTAGHDLGAFPSKVYSCHCERTSVGWHTRPAASAAGAAGPRLRHGCFHAHRSADAGSGSFLAANASAHQQPGPTLVAVDAARGGRKRLVRQAALRGGAAHLEAPTGSKHVAESGTFFVEERAAAPASGPALPKSWDWRKQPELSQPGDDLAGEFDQGPCGSCYAFSGVLALSMRLRIALTRQLGRPTGLDLSWRAAVRCSPFSEGCSGGFPFLIGRHAADVGIYQKTTMASSATAATPSCNADAEGARLSEPCSASCLHPDPSTQPVYFAADYGYVGGFAQGASEEAIMWELYQHGPLSIELSVKAIPLIVTGNSGKVITQHDNARTHDDNVPESAVRLRLQNTSAETGRVLGEGSEGFKFREWLWVDHALLAVGWGEGAMAQPSMEEGNEQEIILGTPLQLSMLQMKQPPKVPFWTIRNSWGRQWGSGGYGKLVRGQNAGGVEISAVWIRPDMGRLPGAIPPAAGAAAPPAGAATGTA